MPHNGIPTVEEIKAQDKEKKIAYCKTLNLTCEQCPPGRAGCPWNMGHDEAVKSELKFYE